MASAFLPSVVSRSLSVGCVAVKMSLFLGVWIGFAFVHDELPDRGGLMRVVALCHRQIEATVIGVAFLIAAVRENHAQRSHAGQSTDQSDAGPRQVATLKKASTLVMLSAWRKDSSVWRCR